MTKSRLKNSPTMAHLNNIRAMFPVDQRRENELAESFFLSVVELLDKKHITFVDDDAAVELHGLLTVTLQNLNSVGSLVENDGEFSRADGNY